MYFSSTSVLDNELIAHYFLQNFCSSKNQMSSQKQPEVPLLKQNQALIAKSFSGHSVNSSPASNEEQREASRAEENIGIKETKRIQLPDKCKSHETKLNLPDDDIEDFAPGKRFYFFILKCLRSVISSRWTALTTITFLIAATVFLYKLRNANSISIDVDRILFPTLATDAKLKAARSNSEKILVSITGFQKEYHTWESVRKVVNSVKTTHIHVGKNHQTGIPNPPEGDLTADLSSDTFRINGRPYICLINQPNPESMRFGKTQYLHLSEMSDCHRYTNLILTKWEFPIIQKIRLHRVILMEENFNALARFIDRYNETLSKVELDECYLCPSSACDAGMLEFPEHDFQFVITRRRDKPALT